MRENPALAIKLRNAFSISTLWQTCEVSINLKMRNKQKDAFYFNVTLRENGVD